MRHVFLSLPTSAPDSLCARQCPKHFLNPVECDSAVGPGVHY